MRLIYFLFLSALLFNHPVRADLPGLILPKIALSPDELAIIINERDPLSVQIGEYYQLARNIPDRNLIRIDLDPSTPWVNSETFLAVWDQVQQTTPNNIQAYALTWIQPYRVGCMSITTAFAAGFDKRWCSEKLCSPTQHSALFNTLTTAPFRNLKLRPTMTIAARTFEAAKTLIDRGIAADKQQPKGNAYLVSTSDKQRNVRAGFYPQLIQHFAVTYPTEIVQGDALTNKQDVMFYFTGKTFIDSLDTLTFLPGAIADHLTSAGGQLTDSKQMSSLRWLEAGATGSYGTVTEPCNLPSKFPHPGIVMDHYLHGRTLIESYWASVQMPGEGIFIGEPLARPFGGYKLYEEGNHYRLETRQLFPGNYRVETAPSLLGPYTPMNRLLIANQGQRVFYLPKTNAVSIRITPVPLP